MTVGLLSFVTLPSVFNGGKSQVNTTFIQNGGDYPFANLIQAGGGWSYSASPSLPAPPVPITELDTNGYVTSIVAGTNGVLTVTQMPTATDYSGTWVLKWDGNGTLGINNISIANAVGSLTSSTGSGRYTFNRTDNGTGLCAVSISATSAAPNNIRNVVFCKVTDEANIAAGKIFGADHMAFMKACNYGVIRSLGWGGDFSGTNTSNVTRWAQRRPTTYTSQTGDIFTPSLYTGITTNSGNDYSVTFTGFSLTDKATAHVLFNATATGSNPTSSVTATTTSGQPIIISWPAHGLAVNNAFYPRDSLPADLTLGTIYYAQTIVDADHIKVSSTRGGSAINATVGATYSFNTVALPCLNINGTGFVPLGNFIPFPTDPFIGYASQVPAAGNVGTVVYDSTLNFYALNGGSGLGNGGLTVGCSPEIFVSYCAALGAHPHITTPYLCAYPLTDFMTSWVQYIHDSGPAWMKPRAEPPNECWNTGAAFLSTKLAASLAYKLWGDNNEFTTAVHNGYGMFASDLGKAISSIYGNDRTKYDVFAGVQTTVGTTSSNCSSCDARLKSSLYVSNSGGDAAFKWVTGILMANYFSPLERFSCQELIDAYAYSVTYASNPTQQSVIAESYVATTIGGGNNDFYTLGYLMNAATNWQSWAANIDATFPVKKMAFYEGDYSPDLLLGDWNTNVIGASKANPCILTLDSTTNNSESFGTIAGNPAVVGMQVTPSGIGGMTQLNGNTYTITAVSGNLVTINVNSSAFGTYTSGGSIDYVNSQTYSNNLRMAGKQTVTLGTITASLYNSLAGLSGSGLTVEFPSNYLISGAGIWGSRTPDIYAPQTPWEAAIVAFNN